MVTHRLLGWSTSLVTALIMNALINSPALAQVAVTLEGSVAYDDNIFLESNDGLPADYQPTMVQDEEGNLVEQPPRIDADGKANDDIIYYTSIGVASSVPFSPRFKSSIEGKLGFMAFGDEGDQNRFVLSSSVGLSTEKGVLPEPLGFSLLSQISSSTYDLAVPGGSTARNVLTHDLSTGLSVSSIELGKQTSISGGYTLGRHDFIGDLALKSDAEDELEVTRDGADWFSNRIDSELSHKLSDLLSVNLNAFGDLKTFTSETGETGDKSSGERDRVDYGSSIGFGYIVSEKISLKSRVGVDLVHYIDDPVVTNIDPNSPSPKEDSDEAGLGFNVSLGYTPTAGTSFSVQGDQRAATDISGQRTMVRSATLNAVQALGEKVQLGGAGKFSQRSVESDLSESSDLLEATASLSFTVTSNVALSLGYNYAKQTAGTGLDYSDLNKDYDSNKLFVMLSAGLVGVKQ